MFTPDETDRFRIAITNDRKREKPFLSLLKKHGTTKLVGVPRKAVGELLTLLENWESEDYLGEAAAPDPIEDLVNRCFHASYTAGWWHQPSNKLPYIPGDICYDGTTWDAIDEIEQDLICHYWPFVIAAKIALIHSEVSEGLDAFRSTAMDDKLSHRLGLETEMGDTMIRQFDLAGAMGKAQSLGVVTQPAKFDLAAAIREKMEFNRDRADHKVENRRKAGGKLF